MHYLGFLPAIPRKVTEMREMHVPTREFLHRVADGILVQERWMMSSQYWEGWHDLFIQQEDVGEGQGETGQSHAGGIL